MFCTRWSRAATLGLLLVTTVFVFLLPACGKECQGCGSTCPDLKKTYGVRLLSTSTCKNLPTFTDTLAHLTVLRQQAAGEQTSLSFELSSLSPFLDIGLAGNLCGASGTNGTTFTFNTSFQQRDLTGGPVTSYTLAGSFLAEQGKDPSVSGTLSMSYFDPAATAASCSTRVLVSSM